jgi:hypothetical protein
MTSRLHQVILCMPDPDDLGFDVSLDCGHKLWSLYRTNEPQLCAQCLEDWIEQNRNQAMASGAIS